MVYEGLIFLVNQTLLKFYIKSHSFIFYLVSKTEYFLVRLNDNNEFNINFVWSLIRVAHTKGKNWPELDWVFQK